MKNTRKIIVGIVGYPLFFIGIILIPLPGPGLIVVFLALMVLSLEFDWAGKRLKKVRSAFSEVYKKAKERADRVEQWGEKRDKKR